MDQLIFLIQGNLESAQISIRSVFEHFGQNLSIIRNDVKSSVSNTVQNFKNRNLTIKIRDLFINIKDAWITFKFVDLYSRCVYFLLTEVTRTHIYFGGMCFIFGTLIGIGMGVHFRNSVIAPQKMRAVITNDYKGLDGVSVIEDLMAPQIIFSNQVLVEVKSAAIDLVDVKIANGYARNIRRNLNKTNPNSWGELPVILGRSCSGIAIAIGRDVTRINQGDSVWLSVPVTHEGTLSEYVVVTEDLISQKPTHLSHDEAAALSYDLLKTWDILVNQAELSAENCCGKRILILDGTSGIGVVSTQILRAWGCHITSLIHSRCKQVVLELGAHETVCYDLKNFEKEILSFEKFDVIINPEESAITEHFSSKFCAENGVVLTPKSPSYKSDNFGIFMCSIYKLFCNIRFIFSKMPWVSGSQQGTLEVNGLTLDKALSALPKSNLLRPVLYKSHSINDAEVAFQRILNTDSVGKITVNFR